MGAESLLRGNGETTSAPEFALPTPTTRPATLSEENRPVSCTITWSNRKVPDKPVRIGTSCEIDGAVNELAPTVPHRQEEEDCVGAGRRDLICAAMFVRSGRAPFGADVSALAATGDVLPDGTESAAIALEDPHGTGWDCAETTIAKQKHEQQSFHSGYSMFLTIMERCACRL